MTLAAMPRSAAAMDADSIASLVIGLLLAERFYYRALYG